MQSSAKPTRVKRVLAPKRPSAEAVDLPKIQMLPLQIVLFHFSWQMCQWLFAVILYIPHPEKKQMKPWKFVILNRQRTTAMRPQE